MYQNYPLALSKLGIDFIKTNKSLSQSIIQHNIVYQPKGINVSILLNHREIF